MPAERLARNADHLTIRVRCGNLPKPSTGCGSVRHLGQTAIAAFPMKLLGAEIIEVFGGPRQPLDLFSGASRAQSLAARPSLLAPRLKPQSLTRGMSLSQAEFIALDVRRAGRSNPASLADLPSTSPRQSALSADTLPRSGNFCDPRRALRFAYDVLGFARLA